MVEPLTRANPAVTSPDTPRSTSYRAIRGATGSVRRVSGEARTRSRGGEPSIAGGLINSHLAAESQRFQRIPLATSHLRSRRFSAPGLCQIVAGGPNLYPGLGEGPPAAVHGGSAAIFKVFMHLSLIVPPFKS